MIVSGGLLLITQQSNDSIENYIIENRSSLDISASESETILDISLKTTDEEKIFYSFSCALDDFHGING